MSFAAECGPVNPLAAFSKTAGQDRSLHQDRYVPIAGPSHRPFRQLTVPAQASSSQTPHDVALQHFDLKPLGRSLPPAATAAGPSWVNDFMSQDARVQHSHSNMNIRNKMGQPTSSWVDDFQVSNEQVQQSNTSLQHHQAISRQSTRTPMGAAFMPPPQPHMLMSPSMPMSQMHSQQSIHSQQSLVASSSQSQWESAFMAKENIAPMSHEYRSASPPLVQNPERTLQGDEALARTAAELLDSVADDTNAKFANSNFINLMRKFKNYEAVVDGNAVVEQDPMTAAAQYQTIHAVDKGKARAVDQSAAEHSRMYGTSQPQTETAQNTEISPLEHHLQGYDMMQDIWSAEDAAREEEQKSLEEGLIHPLRKQFQGDGGVLDEDMMDDRFDNANIIGGPMEAGPFTSAATGQHQHARDDWHHLQRDWDAFEATSTGIRPVSQAQSQSQADAQSQGQQVDVEYVAHDAQSQHVPVEDAATHQQPTSMLRSLAELEKVIEQDRNNPAAWLALGIKQQENEREDMAIRALTRALDLDSSLSEAWLALAISHSNENSKTACFDALSSWIDSRTDLAEHVNMFKALNGDAPFEGSVSEKHAYLTSMLISVAQATAASGIDADVQIALGVLFNSNEEYQKAGDCFGAALSVRPNDHVLYNRLGATLANSGHPEEAMQYYFEALRLQPSFTRANFNLAVSCISTKQHREAAEHLLVALARQEAEYAELDKMAGDSDLGRYIDDSNRPFSVACWETLATCCSYLGRHDLADACVSRDLSTFRPHFMF